MPAKLTTLLAFSLLFAPVLAAQDAAQDDDSDAPAPEQTVEEVIVVTASRTEQRLHEVPAAVSVLTAKNIEEMPADDYGDLLQNVPGLSVTQISARDINVSSRQATSSLATDQLVMLDGRTLYLDFFGFVMWDFLPVNTREIKQIEVVRGPGSAVWGANAMSGVINVITKSPRELAGTSLTLGGGNFSTAFANLSHAGATDRAAYKLSASYYEQDPFDRPTGLVPGTQTPYPPFTNSGTEQPKIDLRVDFDSDPGTVWSFSGGYAGTDGIMHTGIGPFDIDSGSNLAYFKTTWTHRAWNANFFANFLDGDAANLLTVGPDGRPLRLGFSSETYNVDVSNTSVIGDRHILTYGARARQNSFDLSIAPSGNDRDEYGVFIQDELLLGDHVRWLIGARWDDMDPIGSVVSPRTSLLVSPTPDHTFRFSYNEAYRAPSLINNFLDITIVNQALVDPRLIAAAIAPPGVPCELVLSTCTPFLYIFPSLAVGNPLLDEEQMEAFEVGYVGTFGDTNLSISVYRNELTDQTDFFTAANYDSFNPPPGWPVFLASAPFPVVPPGVFPSVFSYRNVGQVVNEGVEIGINAYPSAQWSWFANYSYQAEPDVTGKPLSETNIPPENRFNAGLSYSGPSFFANGTVNWVDKAFWTDVLDARFHGPTDSFTQVNLSLGWRFRDDRYSFTVTGSNVFDDEVQQHVFGDIIGRKISGTLRFNW